MPYFGSSSPRSDYHLTNGDANRTQEQQTISTAISRENESSALAKLPARPTQDAVVSRPPKDDIKKPSAGVTGIVEVESPAPRPLFLPTAGPLPKLVEPKSEFEPIVLALDQMLKGRHQEALKHLAAYDNDKQELFLRLVPIFETFVKKRVEELSGSEIAVLLKQLDAIKDTLRPRSELVVSRMCYCKEANGFGSLLALPDHHQFLTGTADRIGEQVKLYVELKNFTSEPAQDGTFVTKLSCALELRDADKKVVMSKRLAGNETTLKRSSRLNDLYSLYGFYVPPLPAGTYQLTLHIADETNPKAVRVASRSLEFRVTPVANQPGLR